MEYRYSRDEKSSQFNRFKVEEKRTSNVIVADKSYDEAKALAQHLNNGGGFAGWTPYFFAAESPVGAF